MGGCGKRSDRRRGGNGGASEEMTDGETARTEEEGRGEREGWRRRGGRGGERKTRVYLGNSRRGEVRVNPVSHHIRGSIVVSISACHAEDPGSIPGGGIFFRVSWPVSSGVGRFVAGVWWLCFVCGGGGGCVWLWQVCGGSVLWRVCVWWLAGCVCRCLLYTSLSPRDEGAHRIPSSVL